MFISIIYSSSVSGYITAILFCYKCSLLINSLDSLLMAYIQMIYIQILVVSMNLEKL